MSTKSKVSIAAVVGGAFLAGALFVTAGANLFGFGEAVGTTGQAANLDGTTALTQQSNAAPSDVQEGFTRVAQSVNPAVVQIRARKVVEREMPSPFRRFQEPERQFTQGLGSGVVVRSDGHIVTNNHVVENAEELSVRMMDGTEYDAEIVGTDPFSDLAVIRVDDSNLTSISFGDSDELQTGQWVLAFGSPLSAELSNSVTSGIVSSVGRLRPTDGGGAQNYVQTDAAINPGNSGGPLVNPSGELVGINTAIASNTGGFQGIGFAIPSNTVERVVTQIIEQGDVQRAYLGVRYRSIPPALAENESLPQGAAQISQVEEDSPAAEAGLQPRDIVLAVDGERLEESLQLQNLIANNQPGDEVTLRIDRDGTEETYTVTLGSRNSSTASSGGGGDEAPSQEEMMEELGLGLQNVTPRIARRLGLEEASGVVITEIDRSNPMTRNSGLQPRLIIVEAADERVSDVSTFREIYAGLDAGQAFRIVVQSPQGFAWSTSLRKPE